MECRKKSVFAKSVLFCACMAGMAGYVRASSPCGTYAPKPSAVASTRTAALGPTTIMDDVPGNTTISNLVRVGETDPHVASWARAGQPKPGGGGGADTNAVRSLVDASFVGGTNAVNAALATYVTAASASNVAKTVARAMKPVKIGPYLWEIGTEGEDWTAATNRLAKAYPSYGRCTGVNGGRYHGRNLDWEYDTGCSIVVRSPAREGKYAVIGVADGAKVLTDDFMMSEAWDDTYVSLPFTVGDGINEKGVVIQQNIIPTNTASATSAWRTKTNARFVISFAIVRYALDRCTNAYQAAVMIKDKIFVPSEFPYDFHYLVSDRTSSYVVEDNAIYPADVMTNFRVGGVQTNANGTAKWNTVEPFGIGVERYDRVRTNGFDKTTLDGMVATMKDVWYTKTYQPTTTPYWYTEFCKMGTPKTVMNALTNVFVFNSVKAFEQAVYLGEHDPHSSNYRGGHTWQTTHTAIFDKQDLTMRLWVQEEDDSERLFWLKKDGDHGVTRAAAGDIASNAVLRITEPHVRAIYGNSIGNILLFDVWANESTTVPVGDVSNCSWSVQEELVKIYGADVLRYSIAREIEPQMTEKFVLRTHTPTNLLDTLDIVVDWGDGSKENAKSMAWSTATNMYVVSQDDIYLIFSHTYAHDGRYRVSVCGMDYFAFRPHVRVSWGEGSLLPVYTYNLICGVALCPNSIASHIRNASGMFLGSFRLLSVSDTENFSRLTNLQSTFNQCFNLNEAKVCINPDIVRYSNTMFSQCTSLKNAPCAIPISCSNASVDNMFTGCTSMSDDIIKLFPTYAEGDNVVMSRALYDAAGITGIVPAHRLWGDRRVEWNIGTPDSRYGSMYHYMTGDTCSNRVGAVWKYYRAKRESKGISPSITDTWEAIDDATAIRFTNNNGPFFGCSKEIRDQVPVEWGGLNTNIVIMPYIGRQPIEHGTVSNIVNDLIRSYDTTNISARIVAKQDILYSEHETIAQTFHVTQTNVVVSLWDYPSVTATATITNIGDVVYLGIDNWRLDSMYGTLDGVRFHGYDIKFTGSENAVYLNVKQEFKIFDDNNVRYRFPAIQGLLSKMLTNAIPCGAKVDVLPTSGSTRLVTSGGVKSGLDAKYEKPVPGIGTNDLAQSVRNSLESADTAYQKPTDGIPEGDLSDAVRGKIDAASQLTNRVSIIYNDDRTSAVDGNKNLYDVYPYLYTNRVNNVMIPSWEADGGLYFKCWLEGINYALTARFVSNTTWKVVRRDTGRVYVLANVGAENAETLNFGSSVLIGTMYRCANTNLAWHGSIVPSYRKINGIPLTNDITLAISGGGVTNRIESGTSTITAAGKWIVMTNATTHAATTNDLCTVAAAQAMTNGLVEDRVDDYGGIKWEESGDKKNSRLYLRAADYIYIGGGNGEKVYISTDNGEVHLPDPDEVYVGDEKLEDVLDAKADAEDTFTKGEINGNFLKKNYSNHYAMPLTYGLAWTNVNEYASLTYDSGRFNFYKYNYGTGYWVSSPLIPDGSYVATSNMVERVIAFNKPKTLSGRTYDFEGGSNFVKNVYAALTNVIQTLGGSVTNVPTFQ